MAFQRSAPLCKAAVTTAAATAARLVKPQSIVVALPTRLWNAYTHQLHTRPLLTKASMAAIIFFASDSTTQYLLRDRNSNVLHKWDAVRALSGASFGVVATAWLHYWWGALEVVIGARLPVAQYKLANTAVKVAVDQMMGAPLYIYSYYCITNLAAAAIADSSAADSNLRLMSVATDVHEKAASMLLPTMLQHWKLWPAVHTLNFYFVPLPHRVLVQNTVLVGWSGYLSHLNHSPQPAKLMTPDQEIKTALVRRDTQIKLQQQQQQVKTKQPQTAATTTTTLITE